MVRNFYKYSSQDVNIRIAVPDGFHNDNEYIKAVKPEGTGEGAIDHKHLFNYKSLIKIFEAENFKARLIEYWDEGGKFHPGYSNDEYGFIKRSFINDPRNSDKLPNYTSLIVDFVKN